MSSVHNMGRESTLIQKWNNNKTTLMLMFNNKLIKKY